MKKHIESVHDKKKPIQCEICDQSFPRKCEMKKHVELVHDGIKCA